MEHKDDNPSSYDIFLNQMCKFYNVMGKNKQDFIDSLHPVACGMDLDDISRIKSSIIEISKAILDFKETFTNENDEVRLYMDITGGPRNAAMIPSLLVECLHIMALSLMMCITLDIK